MGCFGDGVPWENVPVRFPAPPALVSENQESLETLSQAVWSRDTAQLGFSELLAKTESFDFLSELSCNVTGAVAISTPCGQGSFSDTRGDLCCCHRARAKPPSPETWVMIIIARQILLQIVF